MELGEPDADGRSRPEPVEGSEHVVPAETAIIAIGQQPRPSSPSSLARGISTRETGPHRINGFYAAGDATNGGATVVEAVREGKIAARSVDADLRARRERDSLAREGRPGREDGRAAARSRPPARGQERPGVPRVRAGAPRLADARVHALRRPADPPPRLDRGARRRRRPRALARGGPDVTDGLQPGGLLLVNSEHPIEGAVCVDADHLAPGSVNLVMLGAIAGCLGEPPLESLVAAAPEVLGKKADPAQLTAALEAGHHAAEEATCAA